jgi:hypothetical protein
MSEQTVDILERFMPEVEVSIRTAVHLLKHAELKGAINVQIQRRPTVRDPVSKNKVTFLTDKLLNELEVKRSAFQPILHKNDPEWFGEYRFGNNHLKIQGKERGLADVIGLIKTKRIFVQCKGGHCASLSEEASNKTSSNSKEYAALWSVLGQIVVTERVADNDIMAVAVPLSSAYKGLVEKFQNRPLIKQLGIKFLLVSRDGNIEGFDQLLN